MVNSRPQDAVQFVTVLFLPFSALVDNSSAAFFVDINLVISPCCLAASASVTDKHNTKTCVPCWKVK